MPAARLRSRWPSQNWVIFAEVIGKQKKMYGMKIFAPLLLLSLVACSAKYPVGSPEWLDGYIDTGVFTKESVERKKILYLGSTQEKYSNLTHSEIDKIESEIFDMLQRKYGNDYIVVAKQPPADTQPGFSLSFDIQENRISEGTDRTASSKCYTVTRTMAISLRVENTTTLSPVWAGTLEKSLSNESCNDRRPLESEGIFEVLAEAVIVSGYDLAVDSVTKATTNAPSLEKVAGRIIRGFYETMPGQSQEQAERLALKEEAVTRTRSLRQH